MNNKWFSQWSVFRLKKPKLSIMIIFIIINIFLLSIASILAYFIGEGFYSNIFDAFWRGAIRWFIDPGLYQDDVAQNLRTLSFVFIIIGMITLNGGIIAFITSTMQDYVFKNKSGKTKLSLSNHILILNYNNKVIEIIENFLSDEQKFQIVVLSNQPREDILSNISNRLYEIATPSYKKKLNYIILEGDIHSIKDLDRACYQTASSIIILNDFNLSKKEQQISFLKLLVILKPKEQTIILDILDDNTEKLIRSKFITEKKWNNNRLILLNEKRIISNLIVQIIIDPQLTYVFDELLSFKGSEFYLRKASDDYNFISELKESKYSIPIQSRNLNQFGFWTLVLSSQAKYAKVIDPTLKNQPLSSSLKYSTTSQTETDVHVLVLGTNSKKPYIAESLNAYQLNQDMKIHADFELRLNENILDKIHHGYYKSIFIMNDDSNNSDYRNNSSTLTNLIELYDSCVANNVQMIPEITDFKDFTIVKEYKINHMILSNQYISKIMTQLTLNHFLYPFLMDVFCSFTSLNIKTRKASDLFDMKMPLEFNSYADFIFACYSSQNKNYIAIGLYHPNSNESSNLHIFAGLMYSPRKLTVYPDSIVIYIA